MERYRLTMTLECPSVLVPCPQGALLVRTLWLNYLRAMPDVSVASALGAAVVSMTNIRRRLYVFTPDDEVLAVDDRDDPLFIALLYVWSAGFCGIGLSASPCRCCTASFSILHMSLNLFRSAGWLAPQSSLKSATVHYPRGFQHNRVPFSGSLLHLEYFTRARLAAGGGGTFSLCGHGTQVSAPGFHNQLFVYPAFNPSIWASDATFPISDNDHAFGDEVNSVAIYIIDMSRTA
jgi:hypothetical protein